MKTKKDYATELTEKIMNEIKTKFDKDIIFLSFDYDIEKDYTEIESKIQKTTIRIIEFLRAKVKLSKLNEIDVRKTSIEFLNNNFDPLFFYIRLNLAINSLQKPHKKRELTVMITAQSIALEDSLKNVIGANRIIGVHYGTIHDEYLSTALYGIMPKTKGGKIKFINIKKRHELLTRVQRNENGGYFLETGSQYSHIAHLLSKERKNSRSIPVSVIYNVGYGNNCIKRYL